MDLYESSYPNYLASGESKCCQCCQPILTTATEILVTSDKRHKGLASLGKATMSIHHSSALIKKAHEFSI